VWVCVCVCGGVCVCGCVCVCVCVCVCRHEMWFSGFPEKSEVLYGQIADLPAFSIGLVIYEGLVLVTSGILELGFRGVRILGQNILAGLVAGAIIQIVRCRP
jgi:hypothetical protein